MQPQLCQITTGIKRKGRQGDSRLMLPVLAEVNEVCVLINDYCEVDCNYSAEDDNPGDALFK